MANFLSIKCHSSGINPMKYIEHYFTRSTWFNHIHNKLCLAYTSVHISRKSVVFEAMEIIQIF